MKLISMTDFVLQQFNLLYNANIMQDKYITRTKKYCDFLKKPLELWMFVPCDEKGNVLEEPYNYQEFLDGNNLYTLCEKYQQEKERCLFDGFEYFEYEYVLEKCFLVRNAFIKIYDTEFKNISIDDLRNKHFITPIQLTPTAIKQLGL